MAQPTSGVRKKTLMGTCSFNRLEPHFCQVCPPSLVTYLSWFLSEYVSIQPCCSSAKNGTPARSVKTCRQVEPPSSVCDVPLIALNGSASKVGLWASFGANGMSAPKIILTDCNCGFWWMT